MKKYTTPKGKEIELVYAGRNIACRFVGGGELPEELAGLFTDERQADQAITKYLARKVKDDDKQTG